MKPWLREIVGDLWNAGTSPWFGLAMEVYGLVGTRKAAVPEVGEPNLLYFPAPYHALEVAAAYRGWGGVRDDLPAEKAKVIAATRSALTWPEAMKRLAEPLFLTVPQAMLAGHVLAPVECRGSDHGPRVLALRREVYRFLGFTDDDAADAEQATAMGRAYSIDVPDFWKIVEPHVEELL